MLLCFGVAGGGGGNRTPKPWLEKLPGLSKVKQEVNWLPGPGIPKPEVFRGHDKFVSQKEGGDSSSSPPPQTQAWPSVGPAGWKTPSFHLPSLQSSWQAGGQEQLSGCRASASLGSWGRGPTTPSGTGTVGSLAPSPLLSSRPEALGTQTQTPVFFAQKLRGPLQPSLWESHRSRGQAGLLSCVCVLACSCFCRF